MVVKHLRLRPAKKITTSSRYKVSVFQDKKNSDVLLGFNRFFITLIRNSAKLRKRGWAEKIPGFEKTPDHAEIFSGMVILGWVTNP